MTERRARGRSRFTEADVSRAIRAVKREQIPIACVRIEPDGTILIVPGPPQDVQPSEVNEWD